MKRKCVFLTILLAICMIFVLSTKSQAFIYEGYKSGDLTYDGIVSKYDKDRLDGYLHKEKVSYFEEEYAKSGLKYDSDFTDIDKLIADVNHDYVLDEKDLITYDEYFKAIEQAKNYVIAEKSDNGYIIGNQTFKFYPLRLEGNQLYRDEMGFPEFLAENAPILDFVPDGKIDIKDLTHLKRLMLNVITPKSTYGIENDEDLVILSAYSSHLYLGNYDIRTVAFISRYLVKLEKLESRELIKGNFSIEDKQFTSYDVLGILEFLVNDYQNKVTLPQLIAADANYDGKVTSEDLLRLLPALVGKDTLNPGEWSNEFERVYKTISSIYFQNGDILLGDVDGNGEVTAQDALQILQHIEFMKKGEAEKGLGIIESMCADVDKDGKITKMDAYLILNIVVGKSVVLGDVDGDGEVTASDALMIEQNLFDSELDNLQSILADVNRDGKVDVNDVQLIMQNVVSLVDLDAYKVNELDLNDDGYITSEDCQIILDFVVGNKKMTFVDYLKADLNRDGIVTSEDALIGLEKVQKAEMNGGRLLASQVDIAQDQYLGYIYCYTNK